ncbi:MAG: hypothetical protein KGK00_03455, partial [Paracoccaceae bacterium]|nr:hypothetical protein [Paracoccaceae bacterium]
MSTRRSRLLGGGTALLAGGAMILGAVAQAQAKPLSAIDWLSRSVSAIPPGPPARPQTGQGSIDTSILGATGLDAVGLLPAKVTGLPRNLWQASHSADLARLLQAEPEHLL